MSNKSIVDLSLPNALALNFLPGDDVALIGPANPDDNREAHICIMRQIGDKLEVLSVAHGPLSVCKQLYDQWTSEEPLASCLQQINRSLIN